MLYESDNTFGFLRETNWNQCISLQFKHLFNFYHLDVNSSLQLNEKKI